MLRNNIAIITPYRHAFAHQPANIIRRLSVRPLHSVNAVVRSQAAYRQCAMALISAVTAWSCHYLSREVTAMSAAAGPFTICLTARYSSAYATKSFRAGDTRSLLVIYPIFVPSGPMASGLPNKEKSVFVSYAEGKCDRMALLFGVRSRLLPCAGHLYILRHRQQSTRCGGGVYGMQLPGSSFAHPTLLREALTAAAARRVTRLTGNGNTWMPLGKMIDEKVVVNGIVALLATGGLDQPHHAIWLQMAMRRAF